MTTHRMPTLTAEQLQTIASEAVEDVARQKITTSKILKSAVGSTPSTKRMLSVAPNAKGTANSTISSKTLNNPNVKVIQKSLAGSALSQAEAKDYFKEAFNKVRKG